MQIRDRHLLDMDECYNFWSPRLDLCKAFLHLTVAQVSFDNSFSYHLRMSLCTVHIPNHSIYNPLELEIDKI